MLRTGSWQQHKEEETRRKQSYKRSDGCSSSEMPKLYFPSVLYVGGQFKGCLLLCYRLCSGTNVSLSRTVRNPFDFAIKELILFQNKFLNCFFFFCIWWHRFLPSGLCFVFVDSTQAQVCVCTAVIRLQKSWTFQLKGGKKLNIASKKKSPKEWLKWWQEPFKGFMVVFGSRSTGVAWPRSDQSEVMKGKEIKKDKRNPAGHLIPCHSSAPCNPLFPQRFVSNWVSQTKQQKVSSDSCWEIIFSVQPPEQTSTHQSLSLFLNDVLFLLLLFCNIFTCLSLAFLLC